MQRPDQRGGDTGPGPSSQEAPEGLEELFEAVREACPPAVWSRGVQLARSEAVSGESLSSDEAVLRVATRGGLVSPCVTLHLADEEWECTCGGRDDPCEHVAAAAITLRQARRRGAALPAPARSAGRLRYRLHEREGSLALERVIATGEREHPVRTTLDALARGRVEGPGFSATPTDLSVERALGTRRGGVLPREVLVRVVDALAGCEDVTLDGAPVRVSRERVRPLAVVEDAPGGFRLRVVPDPSVTRRFANDALLCGDVLRVPGESGLTGRELDDLTGDGRFFDFDAAAELAGEVLPSLRERLPVEVRSRRLPRPSRALRPRAQVRVEPAPGGLSVLPLLVYGDPPVARVDAGRLVPLGDELPQRDTAAEQRELVRLERELGLAPGHRVEVAGDEALALAERLRGFAGEVSGDAHRRLRRAPPLVPRLELRGRHLELAFEAPDDGAGAGGSRRVSGEAVLAAWRNGESWLQLPGGALAELPADWLARHGHRVLDLLEARGDADELPAHALPELAALCEDLDRPPPPEALDLAPLWETGGRIPAAELPGDLRAALRPYQRRGADWLCFLRDAGLGALLADDMGLGKTLQALCALRGRTLVVCPTSVLATWEDEAARFRPALRVARYHGPGRALDPAADLTLTSYALLRGDAEPLACVDWDAVVLDESQAIKNPDSQVARAAFALRAGFRLALTGTPLENRVDELWSQMHFLNPGLLGGRRDFQERMARPVAGGDAAAMARLRARIRPFLLRRSKREVAPELPRRTDTVVHVTLEDEEASVYRSLHAATRRDVVAKLRAGGSVLPALEALLRLRQAACHSDLIPGQQVSRSSKVEALLERLEEAAADGHRSLVFSQWTALLDRVEPGLRERRLDFLRLDGSTRDRAGVVRGFQAEDGPPVLLMSLKAGGTGITLTAADHVFLLDPWWNPAVEDQAADRAHRIGQERPVLVHRLVAEGTVEERILALQERKRELAQAALGEGDAALALSRDDLLELLD